MHPVLLTILGVILGLLVGSCVNMGILSLGNALLPPPGTGHDLAADIALFKPADFLSPFLAHALGTLSGAWVAARISYHFPLRMALIIGVFFFMGGAYMVSILPSPLWFTIADLGLTYLPMAWVGWKLTGKATV